MRRKLVAIAREFPDYLVQLRLHVCFCGWISKIEHHVALEPIRMLTIDLAVAPWADRQAVFHARVAVSATFRLDIQPKQHMVVVSVIDYWAQAVGELLFLGCEPLAVIRTPHWAVKDEHFYPQLRG